MQKVKAFMETPIPAKTVINLQQGAIMVMSILVTLSFVTNIAF